MKTIITTLLVLVLFNIANAQLIHYSTGNSGLINDQVLTIAIDNLDNKWIGTQNGVSKFDGITWTSYNHFNSGIGGDTITTISIDSQGNIWFGTYGYGVSKFDGSNWTSFNTSNSGLVNDNITSMAIDTADNIWIGTFWGISKFDGTNWTTYTHSNSNLASDTIRCIKSDNYNTIWIGNGQENISKFDGVNWTNYNILLNTFGKINSIAVDQFNNKWFGREYGILKYDNTNWSAPLNGISFFFLNIDTNNNLWIGTYDGVIIYDGTNTSSINIGSPVYALSIDSQNNKWLGGNGITLYTHCGVPTIEDICYVELTYQLLKIKLIGQPFCHQMLILLGFTMKFRPMCGT